MHIDALDKLLKKEMARKEFLLYVGLFFLALFGISSFLKRFTEFTESQKPHKEKIGFGSGSYGR